MQYRQHRLSDSQRAEKVRVENLLHHVHICRAGQPIPAQVDAGVVHQDIEAAVACFNFLRRCRNCVLPRNVDLNKMDVIEPGLFELPDSLLTSLHVTRAKQHSITSATEITRDFQTYALIRSGYECNLPFICHTT